MTKNYRLISIHIDTRFKLQNLINDLKEKAGRTNIRITYDSIIELLINTGQKETIKLIEGLIQSEKKIFKKLESEL